MPRRFELIHGLDKGDYRLAAFAGHCENGVIVSSGKSIVKPTMAGWREALNRRQLSVIDASVILEGDLTVLLMGCEEGSQLCQHRLVIGMMRFRGIG